MVSDEGAAEFGEGAGDSGERAPEFEAVAEYGPDWRMPGTVRIARLVAWGMAVVGLVCVASAGWLFGARSAGITAMYFVPSWLLGVLALAFGAVGDGIRVTAVLLAVLNMLWTVPSIPAGRPPGWLGPASAIVLVVLLFRRSARRWFAGE